MPVSRSGVMFGETIEPNGVSMARPPASFLSLPGSVWQPAQSAAVAR